LILGTQLYTQTGIDKEEKMKKAHEANDDTYDHTHHIFRAHEQLLGDAVRNRAFYRALKEYITADSTVLDIGSGTGIWAIAAARLGAKRIVAVEKDEMLIPIIRTLIRENGVEKKVEVVTTDSRKLDLRERFDVIISETIGNQGFEEDIVPIMIDAKRRFLKPNGTMIPSAIRLIAAAARVKKPYKNMPAGISLKAGYFETLNLNIPVVLLNKSRLKVLTKPKTLIETDLISIDTPPDFSKMTARWKTNDLSQVNCFAVWAEAMLGKNTKLSTLETSSWSPIIYMIKPFNEERGEIEFTLNLSDDSRHWSAALPKTGGKQAQAYSPVFAYTSLMTQIEMAEMLEGLRKG
jgi:2-polyprenyl-3-methyl-5-hydroxy-6-metoxy-1,4-benzoquinol methylase